MQKELQEQLKQFLGYIIWDCFHNDIKVDDSACNGVTNYIFNGVGGDNKLFEIWLERFNELIDQNFIGKEVIKKIELMRYTEEIKEMRGTEYANGWSDAVDKLLELIKISKEV